jgi:hypothetical protein
MHVIPKLVLPNLFALSGKGNVVKDCFHQCAIFTFACVGRRNDLAGGVMDGTEASIPRASSVESIGAEATQVNPMDELAGCPEDRCGVEFARRQGEVPEPFLALSHG